jgi:hypothetical protein
MFFKKLFLLSFSIANTVAESHYTRLCMQAWIVACVGGCGAYASPGRFGQCLFVGTSMFQSVCPYICLSVCQSVCLYLSI